MNKLGKPALLALLFTCIVIFTGCAAASKASGSHPNGLSSAEAITEVVKTHPDFPADPGKTVTKTLPTGGPSGASAQVKFTTGVEASSPDTYIVTLTKDWGISVNGSYVKSYWKYKVTPRSVTLINYLDLDDLPDTMK